MSSSYLGENLIFIISQPRSGSTLLQRVLGSHKELVISSEPWLMLHPVYGLREGGIQADFAADWAAHGVREFLEHYTDGLAVYDNGIRAFAQTIYGNAIAKAGGTWFIDKTPRYLLILDDLLRLFPAAKFIFLLRNPLSVLASIINTQISHDLYTLERFREELLAGPGNMLRAIDALGDRAIVVRYEDYVTAPEEYTHEICNKLGVTSHPGMVDYADSKPLKGFMQDRTGIQQHTKPSDARIESWKQLLGDRTQIHYAQKYLEALGGDTVTKLGYSYAELREAVELASKSVRGRILLPWRVALMHPGEPKGMDQLSISSYRNYRDYGPLMGRIRTVWSFFQALGVQLRWVFGRAREPQR
jgi:hypothetical protein